MVITSAQLPMTGPSWSTRYARIFALADQGLQGVGSILALALLGRALSAAEFGLVGIAIGAYYFVAGFHRSAIVLPYITEHFVHADVNERRSYHSDWWWLSVMASGALALALLMVAVLIGILVPSLAWLVRPLLYGAAITPTMIGAEFMRRWLFKLERADLAALLSTSFFLSLVGAAAIAAYIRPDAEAGVFAWGFAGLVATLVGFLAVRPRGLHPQKSWQAFVPHRQFATWLSLNIFPYTVYSTATVVILIGSLLGPYAAAVFTAVRTLTNPAVSIVSAIDSTDKPRAAKALAQDGITGLRRSIRNTRLVVVALTGAYLVLIALAAGPLMDLVFHNKYTGTENEVRLLCLAFFLFCLNQPSETLLIVLRASRTMFLTRLCTAIATLIALYFAIPYGISGMAVAIAVSQLVNIVLLTTAEMVAMRRGGVLA